MQRTSEATDAIMLSDITTQILSETSPFLWCLARLRGHMRMQEVPGALR